ncbi:hypothetical protein ACFUTX_10075 [Microbacterium sp. NPDC057407]|uniref:hypothetical protein n=1 Tax=Microbacterium sp. NPDC057407 TaxID=3346120 RepID=UPI00366EB087
MSRKSNSSTKFKKLSAGGAVVALATSLLLLGTSSASAAGSCSSFSGSGSAPSYLVGRCINTPEFRWKCSTDVWGTLNRKTMQYGSTYSTKSSLACNVGYAHSYSFV